MNRFATLLIPALLLAGEARGGHAQDAAPNTLTAAEQEAGWRLLFDGHTTLGWRGYRKDSVHAGWQVMDGALTLVRAGGDIMTREVFANFELSLEWKVAPGGNSGVMYRVSEDKSAPFWTGPEMQVLDDERHADGKSRLTAAGSCFAVYPSAAGAVKPADQWNQARLLVNGAHVEHWLNGVKVTEYDIGSPDWDARIKASKFAPHERFGKNTRGYIDLQDHGDRVAYRNIKIREIK